MKVVMKTAAETAGFIFSLRRRRGMPAPVKPAMIMLPTIAAARMMPRVGSPFQA